MSGVHRQLCADRIAVFLPSLECGGVARIMLNLVDGLIARGIEVDLVLSSPEGEFLEKVNAGANIISLNSPRVLASLLPLAAYIKARRPTALLTAKNDTGIIALWARKLARQPVRMVTSTHSMISYEYASARSLRAKLDPFLIHRFYLWADEIIAVSQAVAEDVAKTARLPLSRIHVIPNPAISEGFFKELHAPVEHPWFAPGSPPVILSAGRLAPEKDYAVLIRAFAIVLQKTKARLMILGDGPERQRLRTLVEALGIASEVALPGYVNCPAAYMARSSLYVQSSRLESLPTVVIETLAAGLRVVATDCPGGTREILRDGLYGILVPVGDPEAMAKEILQALTRSDPPASREAWARYEAGPAVEAYLTAFGLSQVTTHHPEGPHEHDTAKAHSTF